MLNIVRQLSIPKQLLLFKIYNVVIYFVGLTEYIEGSLALDLGINNMCEI